MNVDDTSEEMEDKCEIEDPEWIEQYDFNEKTSTICGWMSSTTRSGRLKRNRTF